MIADTYNGIAAFYDFLDTPFEKAFYQNLREEFLLGIRDNEILEIGVGTGKNLKYYHKSNVIKAIDISVGMLNQARERVSSMEIEVDFTLVEEGRLPFGDDSFETVVATFVIYLQNEPGKLVDEIRRVLKPGGTLIIFEYKIPDNTMARSFAKIITHLTKPLYHLDFEGIDTVNYLSDFALVKLLELGLGWIYGSKWELVDDY